MRVMGKKKMNGKTKKINWKVAAVFILLLLVVDYLVITRANSKISPISANVQTLPLYNKEDLKRYNGENLDAPVYLALDGYVYDVSPGREDFYNPGKVYHYLAGRDSSIELHIAGASIIKKKYLIVGRYIAE